MSKPDWCPQRVWGEAIDLVDDLDPALLDSQTAIESAAKAILAAEQREREACAHIAIGVVNDWERGAKSTPEEKFAAAEGAKAARVVASRIRNRGSEND